MNPRISVLTATRNVESIIPGLYESLRNQSYANFEWIVIDGDSTDSTVALLQEFQRAHSWIRFVSERDFGFYDALNKALRTATGEYYVVAGADDSLQPDALSLYANVLQSRQPDVVLARVLRGARLHGGFKPTLSWLGHAQVFRGSHSVGMLFRKSLHERFGMYSSKFPLLADGYFLKTLLQSRDVTFHAADFVAGTFTEGGMTTTNKLQILAETWQIQMLTERWPSLQILLFFLKVLIRYPLLVRELASRRLETRN